MMIKKQLFPMLAVALMVSALLMTGCKKNTDSGQTYSLKVQKTGNGSVTASWNGGSATDVQLATGIAIQAGKQVTLTATPESNATDIVWNNTEHSATYSLTMSKDETVSVAFIGSNNGITADVYAVGYTTNSAGIMVATLWKNGVKQTLSDGTAEAGAFGVYVSGTDVYVVGSIGDNAILWKNGVAQTLPGNKAYATNVFTSGSNVYVAGNANDANSRQLATLWTNGTLTLYNDPTYIYSNANAVYTSGSKIYVAGGGLKNGAMPVAILWTNGTPQELSDGTTSANASSVYVSGSDVYVGGYISNASDNEIPTIWKNGTKQSLTLPNGYSSAGVRSVFVSNGTVYACGYASANNDPEAIGDAILWKNGTPSIISQSAYVFSLYVLGNDVYVGGTKEYKPALWTNGTLQVLDNTTTEGYVWGIFVK